jgi:hypothetical protein
MAGMKDTELGAWLRQQRHDRGWTKPEMARRLIQAGRDTGDTGMPGVDGVVHNINRWENEGGVSERYRLPYCTALDIHPTQFGPHATGKPADAMTLETVAEVVSGNPPSFLVPSQRLSTIPELTDPHLLTLAGITYLGREESLLGEFAVKREVMMAAHESSDHAAEHEQHGIGEATLDQLHADLARLSSLSSTGAPLPAFQDTRRVRDRVNRLLDRRQRPREQADLYFLAGCLNGLMGITANRLGYPDAAEELLRAGWAYANVIEHSALRGWLRINFSYVMYWRGWYAESRDMAADGLRYAPSGLTGADLYLMHARALARVGDADAARRAVGLAHAAQESGDRDDLVELGGECALSRATTYAMAGTALAEIGGDGSEAARELETAISLYDQGPGPGEEHGFASKALAGTDLALVRLRSGALDAAATALGPVLTLPPAQRIATLTTRLIRVRDELAAPVFRGSPQARDLGDQIEAFGREAVTAGLHSLTS